MTILGPDGRPYVVKKNKPERREFAPVMIYDRYSSYPSNNLSPVKLARIFRESDTGDIYRLMELFEELEGKDTHLFSQFQTRKNAVIGVEWEIMAASQEKKDLEVAGFVEDVLYGRLDMEDIMLDLLDALEKGFSVMEILWNVEDGRAYPDLVWREPKKFRFGDYQELRLLNEDDMAAGILLPPNKFVVHRYKARSGRPNRAGIMWVVSWMTLFKNYTVKDWLAFSEVYGMPIRLGKYDTSASEEDKEALMRAILSMGSDAAGVINKETEVEFVEATRGEGELYENLAKFCNAEISKAILGQTLTTEVGVGGGSRALGETQNEVRRDLMVSDAKNLAKTLNRDLIRPLVLFNFGAETPCPKLKFKTEEPEDTKQAVGTLKELVSMGLPVSRSYVYERFGIPIPQDGEELLEPKGDSFGGLPFKGGTVLQANSFGKKAQAVIDEFVDGLVAAGAEAHADDFKIVAQAIEKANDLKGLRDRLLKTFRTVNKRQMEKLLQKLLMSAEVFGMESVLVQGTQTVQLQPLDFQEAEDYLKKKKLVTPEEFKQIKERLRTLAFTVSKVSNMGHLQAILDELHDAVKNGNTLQEFKEQLTEKLEAKGWEGKLPQKIDLVFRQNVQTAYQVGRYVQMTTEAAVEMRPYWMYDAVDDDRTRPLHKKMDGVVRRYDDEFWDQWYPPNGFGCRCGVISLSESAVKRRGLTIGEGLVEATVDRTTGERTYWQPDEGFRTNPATTDFKPDLSKYDPDVRDAVEAAYRDPL